jgi:hypothetical protein
VFDWDCILHAKRSVSAERRNTAEISLFLDLGEANLSEIKITGKDASAIAEKLAADKDFEQVHDHHFNRKKMLYAFYTFDNAPGTVKFTRADKRVVSIDIDRETAQLLVESIKA